MKIDRRRRAFIALSIFSLATISNAASIRDAGSAQSVAKAGVARADSRDESLLGSAKAAVASTQHAPYDGKDGMPHDGPWVETNAERERKKSKDDEDDDDDDEDEANNYKKTKLRDPASLKTFKEELKEKEIPQSNEGVMDDRSRKGPADGTRGTEGGISEKTRLKDDTVNSEKTVLKKPDSPKEIPPLPHSEKQQIKGADAQDAEATSTDDAEIKDSKKILEKPDDLPDTPHSIPYPENPSSPKDYKLSETGSKPGSSRLNKDGSLDESAVIQPLHSLVLSFTMILFSEIGDKTFLVACLMAMRHDRILVFTAAFSALITMTVLSAVLGHAVPTLIPKNITNFLAAGLFLVFGVKMLFEARKISPDEGVSEEMKEVEMELEEKEHAAQRHARRRSSISPYILESGRAPTGRKISRPADAGRLPSPPASPSSMASSRSASPSRRSTWQNVSSGLNNLFSLLLSPAWVQTFVMTFLGEWGDRSQIATIAMAAGQDYWWVTAGALGGHCICTGVAVIGGKAIAGKVSLRTVTMGGAIAFLVFGVIYLLEAFY